MRPEDILEILRNKPFEPFRVYLTDGAVYEIRHPDMAIVQRSKVTVAVLAARGEILEDPDLLIAATALQHEAPLVTHNASHFSRIAGLRLEDWCG